MITCEKCGTLMPDDSTSCEVCGTAVTPAAASAEEAGEGAGQETETSFGAEAPGGETDDAAAGAATTPGAVTASDAAAERRAAAAQTAPRNTSSTTKVVVVCVVAFLAAVGLIFWQAKGSRAEANMTAEDMALFAEGLSPSMRMQLANSPEERKKIAEDIRKILAVAEEARRNGIADRPEVKRQLEIGRLFVIAQMYEKKQRDAKANPQDYTPKPEEVEAFLKQPGKSEQADAFLEDLRKLGLIPEGQEITEEDKKEFRQTWAGTNLMAQKGIAGGVDKERATHLQIRLQQAFVLNRIYSEELAKKLEPTEEEINAKLGEARKEAEQVVQRARSGEDFDALVKEFSDEPGAKSRGSDLGWFGRAVEGQPGGMVKPFEDAAFALKNEGDISDIVETQFGFHVIKLLGRRTDKGPDGKPQEQVHASHVLIAPADNAAGGLMGAQKTLREKVRDSLVREKQEKAIKEIVERSKVRVPEDFVVKAPDMPQRPMMPPGDFGSPHGELPDAPPAQAPANTSGGSQKGGGDRKK